MEKTEKKISTSKILVYIFFMMITFGKGIGLSGSNKIYILVYMIGITLVAIKIVKDKFTKKEFITITLLMGIAILDYFIGNVTTLLFTAISIACLKNIDKEKVIKIMFGTRLVAFVLMILLSTIGIIDNNIMLHYRANEGFIERHCFGYTHPNLVHSSFSIIVFLFGYIYYKKINIFTVSGIEILNFILYKFTMSRTGFIVLTLYLVAIYLIKKVKTIRKLVPKFLKISIFVFVIVSILLAISYKNNTLVQKLNVLLTGRIEYMNILITNYNIPIIGSDHYNSIVLFDNGYFSMFYEGGILASIWFVYFYYKTNKYLIKNNMEKEMIITIFFLFYCMFESYFMSILMNPTLLFIGDYIFNKKNENNVIKDESVKSNGDM